MSTLVFDIETVGEAWESFDETTQRALTRWAERAAKTPEEYEGLRKDIAEGLGFSPLTGFIVAISAYDLERRQGVAYFQGDSKRELDFGAFSLKPRTEKQMLTDFWEGAKNYDTFVTFNGRGFDVPYLNLRSAIHGIRAPFNLVEGRYLYQQKTVRYIDLQDQMTFYGAMHRRPSLHLFCRAFGIESPKGEGISGDEVASLFHGKRFEDIAKYNAGDVIATAALYEKWRDYLAPRSFQENTNRDV